MQAEARHMGIGRPFPAHGKGCRGWVQRQRVSLHIYTLHRKHRRPLRTYRLANPLSPRVSTCNVALLPMRGTDVLLCRPVVLGSPVVRLSVESSGMASGWKMKRPCSRCRSDYNDSPLASPSAFKTLAVVQPPSSLEAASIVEGA